MFSPQGFLWVNAVYCFTLPNLLAVVVNNRNLQHLLGQRQAQGSSSLPVSQPTPSPTLQPPTTSTTGTTANSDIYQQTLINSMISQQSQLAGGITRASAQSSVNSDSNSHGLGTSVTSVDLAGPSNTHCYCHRLVKLLTL